MIQSIELQMISKILTEEDPEIVDKLCSYDPSYYSVFRKQIEFILDHKYKFGNVPDVFTFQAEFIDDDISLVSVNESVDYLEEEIKKNKQYLIFLETFNKLKNLDPSSIEDVWKYIGSQYDNAMKLVNSEPMDIIHQAKERAQQVVDFSKKTRIPTGFDEVDKLMYGGLSTVEELLIIIARTNTGKSWICTKMAEAAHSAGFPVAYYSPEMQSPYLATRFDTWKGHYKNSDLFRGVYTEQYKEYIDKLPEDDTPVFIIEDKDFPSGVSPKTLDPFIKKNGIRLLIIDGLSYMVDDQPSKSDYDKYKHICADLFTLSKKYGCAVVVTMQANRATQELKDDKGEPFPNVYSAEGSDHPARIATQVFAVRQIFDKHVLDIRLEKSRNAQNTKPVLSYAWDINVGNMSYLEDGNSDTTTPSAATIPNHGPILNNVSVPNDLDMELEDLDDDDVEF